MGAGLSGTRRILCEGDDIVTALNKVFDQPPTNPDYQGALEAKEAFALAASTGKVRHLLAAYMAAGVEVASWEHWNDYLKDLDAKDATNIKTIAQTRYDALTATPTPDKIHTDKQPPAGNHKVKVTKDKPNHKVTIVSPFTPDDLCP